MTDKRCKTCGQRANCRESWASWIFFIIGMVSTVAVRVVTFLMHFDPLYAKISWYIGIIGFFAFFAYKFKIGVSRSRAIERNGLIEKTINGQKLNEDDARIIGSILCSLVSRKERINFFFLFGLSAFALAVGFYMDFVM